MDAVFQGLELILWVLFILQMIATGYWCYLIIRETGKWRDR